MEVKNKRWTDEEFLASRRDVLARWPTGREIDLGEAVAYHQRLPDNKVYAKKLPGLPKPAFRLSCGWATAEQTIAHMKALEKAGAQFLNWEPDSYTRKSRLQEAQKGLEQSLKLGKSMLNGYPFVNHGLKTCREVGESTGLPLMFNGNNDEEPMLLAEMGFAAGNTSNSINDVRDLINHGKDYPLDKRIGNNQYVCRLAGYYTERGCPILMWPRGIHLHYCPPSPGIAIALIETLTAAEQGVRYFCMENELRGNMVQDIAGLRALVRLAVKYLHKFGYTDITMFTATYSWLGAWPANRNAASAFLAWLTATTALAGADLFASKSIDEAVGVTSIEASIDSAEIIKQALHIACNQPLGPTPQIDEEQHYLELEAGAIVEKVLELGDGDPLVGVMKAVQVGVIDVAFSSWGGVRGKVLPIRDRGGAFRFLDTGNLPFSPEVIQYHRRKIAERERAEGRAAGVNMLMDDVNWLSGEL